MSAGEQWYVEEWDVDIDTKGGDLRELHVWRCQNATSGLIVIGIRIPVGIEGEDALQLMLRENGRPGPARMSN